MQNRRRLKVILVKPKGNFFDICYVSVELANIHITSFGAVAVRIKSLRLSRLVVRERPKVLRPVTQGRDRFLEGVGTGDTIGSSEPLKQ